MRTTFSTSSARCEARCGGFRVICTCEWRKTAEVDSGVASAGVAARVVAETANAGPGPKTGVAERALRAGSDEHEVVADQVGFDDVGEGQGVSAGVRDDGVRRALHRMRHQIGE